MVTVDQDAWLGRHLAFMAKTSRFRPQEIRRRALVAIDAGGPGGAAMADVHRAVKGARMPAWLVNMVVDRLVEDGHACREVIPTLGRPRVQVWSFRHAPAERLLDMAKLSRGVDEDYTRPRWEGMVQENILIDVLRQSRGEELRVKDLEIAAWQIYADANGAMSKEMFRGGNGVELTKGQMKKLLMGLVRQRYIRCNAEEDAFCL